MDNYKLKFENGRNCTIQADNVISFQDKINDAENRFDSECVAINDNPIKKHSLGGFLVGATIGAIVGNSVPAHSVSKTTKGVKQTAKKVTRTVKKQVKKFEGGGRIKVGVFNEAQLKNKEDKQAVEQAQKETGLTYIDSKIIKKGGKIFMEVYLIPNEEYYNSNKFEDGGSVDTDLKKLSEDDLIKGYIYPLIPDKSKGAIITGIIEYAPNFGGEKAFRIWSGGTNDIPHTDFEKFKKALVPYLVGMNWSIGEKQINPKNRQAFEKNLEVANLEVVNLGGDRYDGGVQYEVRENGKVISKGDIVGDHGLTFKGQEYDGLWNLAKGINANLIDRENYYENGGSTNDEKYCRVSDDTKKGINEGYVWGEGEMYFETEQGLIDYIRKDILDKESQSLSDEFILKESYDNEEYYYTEWDCDSEIEEQGYYYAEDGTEVEIASKGKKLRTQQMERFEGGGKAGQKYKVFNYSDNLFATDETFKTKALANAFIKEFRKRFIKQGYYKDNNMRKIKPEDIDLLAIPSDFNPFQKFKDGGSTDDKQTYVVDVHSEIGEDSYTVEATSGRNAFDEAKHLYKKENPTYQGEISCSMRDKFKDGGGVDTENKEQWQIKNSDNKYYSIGMDGKIKWFESPDLGYTYTKLSAEKYKNHLESSLGFKDLQVVKYNKDWWKYEAGGMSSMGMPPQLAIANEISNKLPATTSAIDKRIAEKVYSDKPSAWEDRGLQKMATGGMVGNEIVFDRWGEHTTGTITESMSNGNFAVSSGMGSYLVEPNQVISITPRSEKSKKGWFFAQGGSTNSGLSWQQDHAKHNKSESYERPISERKKFAGGGGLKTNKMLSNEQIADFLLSDIPAYKEYIREILIGRLMDSSNARTYWDAWFRGAEWEDLERAEKGIIYKKFANGGDIKSTTGLKKLDAKRFGQAVDYIYYDDKTQKFYFIDFENRVMEIKNKYFLSDIKKFYSDLN